MHIVDTERLRIRTITLSEEDIAFDLALLNDPTFLEHIGDKGVRTLDDARKHLENGALAMQAKLGHSMYVVELKDGTRIGMCGLIKRDTLEDVDVGYAFMPQYRGSGYAYEAARAVVEHARALGIPRLAGIVSPKNEPSNRLLQKLGLKFKCLAHLTPEDPGTNLYIMELGAQAAAA